MHALPTVWLARAGGGGGWACKQLGCTTVVRGHWHGLEPAASLLLGSRCVTPGAAAGSRQGWPQHTHVMLFLDVFLVLSLLAHLLDLFLEVVCMARVRHF